MTRKIFLISTVIYGLLYLCNAPSHAVKYVRFEEEDLNENLRNKVSLGAILFQRMLPNNFIKFFSFSDEDEFSVNMTNICLSACHKNGGWNGYWDARSEVAQAKYYGMCHCVR